MALTLTVIDKKALPKSVSTANMEANTPPTKGVFKKFEALGPIAWGSQIRAFPGGAVAVIETADREKRQLALAGDKDKAARIVEHVPIGAWLLCDLRDGTTLLIEDRRGEAEAFRCVCYEVALPSGDARCVYDGPSLASVLLGPPGYLVAQSDRLVRLIRTDGGAGTEVCKREWTRLEIQTTHFATAGGRIQLVFSESPYEIIALGVYGDELRTIATLTQRFLTRFIAADGRVFARIIDGFFEVHGLAEAYEAGAAGEQVAAVLAPGELGFRFADLRDFRAPDAVHQLSAINHERGELLPCRGGFATLLAYPHKRHALAIIDAATPVARTVELPHGGASDVRIDEAGATALWSGGAHRALLEIAIPSGTVQPLALPGDLPDRVLFDFADAGRVIMASTTGVRLFAIAAHALVEVARVDIPFTHSLATAAAGRIAVVDCTRADGRETVAVIGVYGDELRLLGELPRPVGPAHHIEVAPRPWLSATSWRRIGARLFTGIVEWNELQGLAELYARGATDPGRPFERLRYVAPTIHRD